MMRSIEVGRQEIISELFDCAGDYVRTFELHERSRLVYHLQCAENFSGSIELTFNLVGPQAQATLRGLCMLAGFARVAITTKQLHAAAHTRSDVLIKGLVASNAHLNYRGTIVIEPNAHQSHAAQFNKNMLLGAHARAHAIPSLEVLASDVRCAHGSAVGQLHPDHLYYLQSRGFTREQAQRILLAAFCADVQDVMDGSVLMERIDSLLKEKE